MSPPSHALSLSDFDVSAEQGFLPPDPRKHVDGCPPLNDLGQKLPKLLSARSVRPYIDGQSALLSSIPASWQEEDYRAAIGAARLPNVDGDAAVHGWSTIPLSKSALGSMMARRPGSVFAPAQASRRPAGPRRS